jgi:hypothetical protein
MKYLLLVLTILYPHTQEPIVVIENLEIASTHQGTLVQTPDSTILWIEEL